MTEERWHTLDDVPGIVLLIILIVVVVICYVTISIDEGNWGRWILDEFING